MENFVRPSSGKNGRMWFVMGNSFIVQKLKLSLTDDITKNNASGNAFLELADQVIVFFFQFFLCFVYFVEE